MYWVVVVIALSAILFAIYAISLVGKIVEMDRLRKEAIKLPYTQISELTQAGQRVKIKGRVLSLGSSFNAFLSDQKVFYSRLLLIPQKRGIKPIEKKRIGMFHLSDGASSISVSPVNARFLVDRISMKGEELPKKIAIDSVDLNNYNACEELLAANSEASVLGTLSIAPNGSKFIENRKKAPLVIFECSQEAFHLIYYRFLIRFILLFISMALTSIVQFYILYLAILPNTATPHF